MADCAAGWLLLDFQLGTYQRCDGLGCDTYAMTVSEKAFFTYIQLPEHPDAFLKMGLAGLFVEVAALGVSTINSLGVCTPQG